MPTPIMTVGDEIHHGQSDLERAALDRRPANIFRRCSKTPRCWSAWGSRSAPIRMERFTFRSRRASTTHSAGCASISPTSSWFISTTPRTNSLFALDRRAFSHGCMRVQDPAKYAEVLLSHRASRATAIRRTASARCSASGEVDISVSRPSSPSTSPTRPHFVDEHGKLEFREDIYGRDKALLAHPRMAIERKVVDIPVERRDNMARRQALAISDLFWGDWGWGGGHHYAGGQKFFARLFGSSFAQSPPVPPRPLAQRGAQHR